MKLKKPSQEHLQLLDILSEVIIESQRANEKHGNGLSRADGITSNLIPAMEALRTLVSHKSEVGTETWTDVVSEELLEAITEPDEQKRERELIQVASVCCRWVLAIRRRRNAPLLKQ